MACTLIGIIVLAMATGTGSRASGSSAGISSGAESSTSSSTSSSMLDRLRAPTLADIARKRKVKSNPPPTGTWPAITVERRS